MFSERILKGYEELRSQHALKELSVRHSGREAMSVVVCHGGSISAILYHLFPKQCQGNLYYWIPDPGHGYVLQLEDEAVTDLKKFYVMQNAIRRTGRRIASCRHYYSHFVGEGLLFSLGTLL